MATPTVVAIADLDMRLRNACIERNTNFMGGYISMSDEKRRARLNTDWMQSNAKSIKDYIAQFVERGERPDKETFWKAVKTRDITIIKLFVDAFRWESEIMDDVLVRSCQRESYAPMEVIEFLVANGANILAKNAGVLDALMVEGAPIEMVRKVMTMGGGYISDFTLQRLEFCGLDQYYKTMLSFGVKLGERAMKKYTTGKIMPAPRFYGRAIDVFPDHLIDNIPEYLRNNFSV